MTDDAWRPPVPTGREEALTETFPNYLREAIFPWMKHRLPDNYGIIDTAKFLAFQNAARTDIGFRADGGLPWEISILPRLRNLNDANFTNLVDYFASTSRWPGRVDQHPLEKVLSDGGSAWAVIKFTDEGVRLTKRVPDGVRKAFDEVTSASGAASLKLREAWMDAYGTNPRASVAYSNAVVAVETAALSVIPTGAAEPTLASVFSVLESETPKWGLVFRDSDKAPGGKSLAMMLRTLWRGHESRHGREDYADASLEEARAAVILAATLVQWFTSGVVAPVKS